MALPQESVSMALFCDFENVALGVRDANYERFDIKPVLERLLLKGSIVVKKAYCDWERYKGFKAAMHEASFELIEIPHVRQSGKNSADIRLVVDALDLCYTKLHVDTFVIISGDSDFSPLVSKLRENAKKVIGVGVKNSTSDLLVANCDEFIFYDDLVREQQRAVAKANAAKRAAEDERQPKQEAEARKAKALAIAVETYEALVSERGESGKLWASVLKSAIKRRKPDFNESYYGFRAFGNLLDEAQARGLLEVGRDEKSGAYVYRNATEAPRGDAVAVAGTDAAGAQKGQEERGRRRNRSGERADNRPANQGDRNGGRGRGDERPPSESTPLAAGDAAVVTPDAVDGPEAATPETMRSEHGDAAAALAVASDLPAVEGAANAPLGQTASALSGAPSGASSDDAGREPRGARAKRARGHKNKTTADDDLFGGAPLLAEPIVDTSTTAAASDADDGDATQTAASSGSARPDEQRAAGDAAAPAPLAIAPSEWADAVAGARKPARKAARRRPARDAAPAGSNDDQSAADASAAAAPSGSDAPAGAPAIAPAVVPAVVPAIRQESAQDAASPAKPRRAPRSRARKTPTSAG
ncbi:NYN domain-containing protein [Chitinasiproducens palmae]|uniref:NYN domain-containing protein n=1 Tax=Chitinasiproducens palmae TaxID=1770053 RepID=A0A1H2PIK8_9BURK|nr:NYN domain-containing protein [Chitinasiproducens palmae]SDV46129.1 NYN domain-containing protein [Chitinasiproducens palmae]